VPDKFWNVNFQEIVFRKEIMFTNATYSQREVNVWSGMDFSMRYEKRHRLKYMPLWIEHRSAVCTLRLRSSWILTAKRRKP